MKLYVTSIPKKLNPEYSLHNNDHLTIDGRALYIGGFFVAGPREGWWIFYK